MKTLFLFEFKKLLKQKTIWFLVGVTMVAILFLYGFQVVMSETTHQQVLDHYDLLINLNLEIAEQLSIEREEAIQADDEAWIEEVIISEDYTHQSYEEWLQLKADYKARNFEQILQKQLDSLEFYVDP